MVRYEQGEGHCFVHQGSGIQNIVLRLESEDDERQGNVPEAPDQVDGCEAGHNVARGSERHGCWVLLEQQQGAAVAESSHDPDRHDE